MSALETVAWRVWDRDDGSHFLTRSAEEVEVWRHNCPLTPLAPAQAEIERLTEERDEARSVVRDTLWMARRYADGRKTYAVGMFNDAAELAIAGGYASGEPDGTMLARDGDKTENQTIEDRALAAEEQVRVLSEALEKAEASARLYAGYYPEGSDGRNTFIILADHIAALQQREG